MVIAGCLAYREGRPGDSFEVAGCCRGKEIPTSGRIKRCNLEQQQEIIKLHTRKRILLEGVGTCGRPCAAWALQILSFRLVDTAGPSRSILLCVFLIF